MGSPFCPALDEVHCLCPLCSHTCCWEAERRICKGKPQKVKALTPSRAPARASEEDRFPAITVVNASEWPDAGSPLEVFPPESEDDLAKAASNTLISWGALPSAARKQVQIPLAGSAMPTHLETHRENTQTVKQRTITISPLPSYSSVSQSSKPTVMWVPSSCYVPFQDSQHRAKSPRLTVKEVIFLPSVGMNKSVENKDKAKKRALLKQTPLKSQLNQEGKGSPRSKADADLSDPGLSWPGSDSGRQVKKASAPPQVGCLIAVSQTLAAAPEAKADQQPPRSEHAPHLRNKPTVSEPVRERIQRRHTQEQHHTSKYTPDLKTRMDGTDWKGLKRHLWTRHTQAVNSEHGPSSSQDRAYYVLYSLHPVPIPCSHCLSKSSSSTVPAKLVHYMSYGRAIVTSWHPCSWEADVGTMPSGCGCRSTPKLKAAETSEMQTTSCELSIHCHHRPIIIQPDL